MAASKYVRLAARPALVLVTIVAVGAGILATRPTGTVVLFATDASITIPDTTPPDTSVLDCKGVAIIGQSNANGEGRVSELSGADVTYADAYTDVQESVRLASGTANPPSWTEYSLSDTQPRLFSGVLKFGVDVSMARYLFTNRPEYRWVIVKAGIGGTTLADTWDPSNASPSIFENVHDWIDTQMTAADCTLSAYVWIQGENDAMQVSRAAAYGTNLTAYVTALRVRYPAIPFIYGRLHISASPTYTATVRAGQEALSASSITIIDQDTGALRADGLHYTTPSVLALGTTYGTAVSGAIP
jgi:hypothetical protein